MADAEQDTELPSANEESLASTGAGLVGRVLGNRYRIQRRIGSGGMADVYEVSHVRLRSPFAAKILRKHQEDSVRRFLREARLLAQLKSDHIVTVFDVGDPNDETPFYVMELLSGRDLRRLLTATPELSIDRAVKIISDACLGLDVAHAAGLIHRDLKPENLFVTHRDTGEEVAKLLDFGVAKASEGTSTEHGTLIGTVRYMAPEQIEHAGVVSPRADVHGLGAILYECLAGRPPHVADSVERLLFKVLNEPIESVRAHRSSVPEELDAIILCALERDPSRRFPTASAFAEALRPFAGTSGLGPATVDTTSGVRAPRWARRRRAPKRLWFAVAASTLLALTGAAVLHRGAASDAGVGPPKIAAPPKTATPAVARPASLRKEIAATENLDAAPKEITALTAPSAAVSARPPGPARLPVARAASVPPAPAAEGSTPKPRLTTIETKNPYDP